MNGSNSGTSGATVAVLDFKPSVPGDAIGDKQMRELCRRLEATIEGRTDSDIVGTVTEPTDKTLIWWPKDPTSGTRIGRPKTYDANSGTWVELGSGITLPSFNRWKVGGGAVTSTGASNVNVDFEGWGNTNYHVSLTPTTKQGSQYNASPGSLPNFAWLITNKANNQFTVAFYGVPSGGIGFEWRVQETDTSKV